MKKWFLIIRPQTLFASLCPVLVATMVVSQFVAIPFSVAAVTAVCAVSLQVLSNLINDYYDFQQGADQAGRVGYRRAMAEGEVTASEMRVAIYAAFIFSTALGAALSFTGGWRILLIGVFALLCAWLYTATRYSLSYLGLGDVFVMIFYGLLAGYGTAYLLDPTGCWPLSDVLYASAVNGLLSMNVLMINNLRDINDDKQVNKRTLPVRFGLRAGQVLMGIEVVLMPVFAVLGLHHWLPAVIVLPQGYVFIRTLYAKGAEYNICLLLTGLSNVFYTLLVCLTILIK